MLSSVGGSVVLIAGASKGIGKGIANVFARNGCKLLLMSRNKEKLSETAGMLETQYTNSEISYFAGDVSDHNTMLNATKQCMDEFGALDKVIMNAGIYPQSTIETMEEQEWDSVFNTNIKSVYNTVKSSIPYLKLSENSPRIILTSSITGPITGFPGWSHYAATKSAMLGFMRSAAIELAPYKITINAVLPGNVMTEGVEELGQEYIDSMCKYIPLNRLGTTEEIASIVMFLASKEASFITGQTIVADGGQTLPECIDL